MKVNLLTKLILKFFPKSVFCKYAKDLGVSPDIVDRIHNLFGGSKRIDIFPYQSGKRGFLIVIDQKAAIYFNQDHDHFVYDGFEEGEYNKGEVTVFDGIEINSPYRY